MFSADKEGFWVSKMTLCQETYIPTDLWKLQQLESSASQAELVQAIQLLKRRPPRKSMKTRCKFKEHWKDDYQCIEHDPLRDNMFCKVCKSQHMFCVFCCFFCACLFATIGLHKQEMSQYAWWLIISLPFELVLFFFFYILPLNLSVPCFSCSCWQGKCSLKGQQCHWKVSSPISQVTSQFQ